MRPINAPAAFIHPCQPIVAKQPPTGPGWAHELKHDGYRLQIHVRDGRVKLYTMNGADWSKRHPLIVRDAARIDGSAIIDAEVVWLDSEGMAVFDALHSRVNDAKASACAFDLLMLNGEDLRRKPYVERKALRKILRHGRGIPSNMPKVMATKCLLLFVSLGWKASSQRNSTRRIAPVPRKLGSKSKIRKRQRQREPSMAHSEVNDAKLVLVSARKSRGADHWDKDDYDVRLGDASGAVIGRIMRHPQAAEAQPWFWTITAREQPPSAYNRGYAASREQAMRYFKARHIGSSN